MQKRIKTLATMVTTATAVIFLLQKTQKKHRTAKKERRHVPYGLYEAAIKRLLDFTISVMALVLLFPVMGMIALLVRVKLGSPVLFKQERPGLDEQIFTLYKFRTMTDEKDKEGKLLSDEKRLTKFGKWLRSTSLDELPELFNILKGDMSLVGPRPLLVEYLPYYTERERTRHDVRPGLTGLAQINGRNNLNWTQRFGYDLEYVKKISFLNDCQIILLTVLKVIKQRDIVSDGKYKMPNLDCERKSCNENIETG